MNEPTPRILFIDDDSVLSAIYRDRLKLEHFDIMNVSDGEKVVEAALDYNPDLVVLDLMLPKTSGFSVLEKLRKTPKTQNLKIVVFSALGSREDRERAAKLGSDDYIVKSEITINDLVKRLRELLATSKA